VQSQKTNIAAQDLFKTVSVEEFCEIARIGRTRADELFETGAVKSVLVGRLRLVLLQSWYDHSRDYARSRRFSPPAAGRGALRPPANQRSPKRNHRRPDAVAGRRNIRARTPPLIRRKLLPQSQHRTATIDRKRKAAARRGSDPSYVKDFDRREGDRLT